MILTPEIRSNLGAFNAALKRYAELTTLSLDDVLEKKGRALSVAIYQGYAAKMWRSGRTFSSILGAMFSTATRLPRSAYRQGNRLTNPDGGQVPVRIPKAGGPWASSIPATTSTGAAMGAWRAAVNEEMLRRRAGVGVLGASFLWYRYRKNSTAGRFLVKNKACTALGAVEKGPGFLRIIGYTPGLSYVDLKYGILSAALAREADDMDEYVQRKMRELWGETVSAFSRNLSAA